MSLLASWVANQRQLDPLGHALSEAAGDKQILLAPDVSHDLLEEFGAVDAHGLIHRRIPFRPRSEVSHGSVSPAWPRS